MTGCLCVYVDTCKIHIQKTEHLGVDNYGNTDIVV